MKTSKANLSRVVRPSAYTSKIMTHTTPQPATGEILPTADLIPCQSFDPIPTPKNAPHRKPGYLPTVRVT